MTHHVSRITHSATRNCNANSWAATAALLGIGELTLRDIVEALVRPGRDPRDSLPPIILRRDVLTIDDLREGMALKGTVRNVVDFGAFVDIGVKQDGLVHVSKMAKKYVRTPTRCGRGRCRGCDRDQHRPGAGRVGLSMVG